MVSSVTNIIKPLAKMIYQIVNLIYNNKIHLVVLIIFSILVIFLLRVPLFNEGFIINPWTSPLSLENFIKTARFYPYIWNNQLSIVQVPNIFSIHYIFIFIAKILNLSLVKMVVIEYIVIYFLTCIGMYFLTYYLLSRSVFYKNKFFISLSSLLAGLYYLFFPEFTIIRPFRGDILLGYALAPWIFLLYIKSLEEKNIKYLILSVFLFSILAYNPRWIIFISLLLFVYTTLTTIWTYCSLKGRKSSTFVFIIEGFKYYRYLFAFIGIFLVFNIQLLHSFVQRAMSSGSITCLSTDLINVRFQRATVLNLMRGLGTVFASKLFRNPPIPVLIVNVLSILAVVIIFFSLLFIKDFKNSGRRIILFLSLIAAITTLLFSNTFSMLRNWIILNAPLHSILWRAFSSPKFQFFIGFSHSILLGYSVYIFLLKITNTTNINTKKIFILIIFIIFISSLIMIPSWPLLTGDLNGNFRPFNLPKEYYTINTWLRNQQDNFKVLWAPKFQGGYQPIWANTIVDAREILTKGSGKPTYDFDIMPIYYYYRYTVDLHTSLLSRGNIAGLGILLGVLGIKYLIIHNDIRHADKLVEKQLKVLEQSEDFKKIYNTSIITVFENEKYHGRILIFPSHIAIVYGGLEQVRRLINVLSINNIAIILGDYQINKNFIKNGDLIVLPPEKNLMDLCIHFLSTKYIIVPSKYTDHYDVEGNKWSKAYLSDPHHGAWTPFISKMLDYYMWEFSYNLNYGLVFASKRDVLYIPVNINKSSTYLLFIRVFKSPKGGKIKVDLANLSRAIDTINDKKAEFSWVKVGEVYLTKGRYIIKVENIIGDNAINILVLLPKEDYIRIKNKVKNLLQNKTIIYIFELSNFDKYKKISRTITIVKGGTYRLAIRGIGRYRIEIGNYSFVLNTNKNFVYTPLFYLKSGVFKIEVSLLNMNKTEGRRTKYPYLIVLLYSSKNTSTLEKLFKIKESPTKIISYKQVNPTFWEIHIKAEKPFVLGFTEAYDPLWEAEIYNGSTLISKEKPFPLYSVINGYLINETGNLTIILRYIPQIWFNIELKIMIIVAIILIIYMIVPRHTLNKLLQRC